MKAALSHRAVEDLLAAAKWIKKDNPSAAKRFRTEVAKALPSIGRNPNIGVQRPSVLPEPYRIFVLGQFPYVLIYNSRRAPPVVMRIFHGARDMPELLQGL